MSRRTEFCNEFLVRDDTDNFAVGRHRSVAKKLCAALFLEGIDWARAHHGIGKCTTTAGRFMTFASNRVTGVINLQALLRRQRFRQFNEEAISLMQIERVLTGNHTG